METVKKVVAAIVMVATLAATTPVYAASGYYDVPAGYWATDYIYYAQSAGIMNGVGDGRFAPEDMLVMAQVCQILFNLSGQTVNTNISPWYKQAVDYVQNRTGIAINPTDICSRVMACKLIYRLENGSSGAYGYNSYGSQYYTDTYSLDAESQRAIAYCTERGIVSGGGDGKFYPNGYLTRAQAAKIFSLYSGGYNSGYNYGSNYGYGTATAVTVPTTISATSVGSTNSLTGMKQFATSLGLYAETSSQNLLIYTPSGYYTYTLSNGSWYVAAASGRSEAVDAAFVQQWIRDISQNYTDAQKVAMAKEQIFANLEAMGLMPEQLGTYSNGAIITFDAFGGVPASAIPSVASGYAGSTTLSIDNGALILQGSSTMTADSYLSAMQSIANRLTIDQKISLAVSYIEMLARQRGWTVQTASQGNHQIRVSCYPNAYSSYYVFVIGGSSSVEWYNEVSGRLVPITRESVKMTLG